MRSQRHQWEDVPQALRDAVVERIGSSVVEAVTQPGGFSSGVAAVLTHEDGTETFVKAIHQDNDRIDHYRHEAKINAGLPEATPAPKLRFTLEAGDWIALSFDAIEGKLPSHPWNDSQLSSALEAIDKAADVLTPNPVEGVPTLDEAVGGMFHTWRNLAANGQERNLSVADVPEWGRENIERLADLESKLAELSAGDTLAHFDIRSDNIVIDRSGDAWLVDWSWPCVGAQWVDLLLFLATVAPERDVDQLFTTHRLAFGLDSLGPNALLAAIAGYWLCASKDPGPDHAPHVRKQQMRFGRSALTWLGKRLDLEELGIAP